MTERQLTYDDLGVNINDVYEQMGYLENKPDADVVREVETMLADIKTWLQPKIVFHVMQGNLDVENKTIELSGNVFNCGRIVSRQLRGSDAYAIFICTAGLKHQELMEQLTKEGDMVKLYTAHAIGSVLAERTADYMETILQAQIDKLGWHRTNRFSPGYCGWHVREQQMLFPLFKGHTADVRLTDSSLMMPIKSVSGIIGLGPNVRYNPYTCGLCDYEKCYKRRKKQ